MVQKMIDLCHSFGPTHPYISILPANSIRVYFFRP